MSVRTYSIIQATADGSHTIFVPALNEHYHSVNGAIQESVHVFIQAGLKQVDRSNIRVLEIGFGTGLNAFLTLREIENGGHYREGAVTYYAIEQFPPEPEVIRQLNYAAQAWPEQAALFDTLHAVAWEEAVAVTSRFTLQKMQADARACVFPAGIDLVYFDAFAPEKQPELWEQEMFDRLYACMADEAIIVTYCAKGEVRRRMQAAGFRMERLEGPPGKRHILFGRK